MSDPAEPAGEGVKLGDLVTTAGFLVGLVAIWLYLSGWAYAYSYFDRFRLPLLMLDLPYEHVLVYGFLVLRAHWPWLLGLALALLLGTVLWPRIARHLPRRLQIASAMVLTAGLLWAGFLAGKEAGLRDFLSQRGSDYRAYPRVALQLGEAEGAGGTDAVADRAALASGCYRLLLQNNDRVFLIRPFKNAPAAELPLSVISMETVAAMRVLPDYTSCP